MTQRILSALITLVIVSMVSFAAVDLAPGSPVELILGENGRNLPQETIDRINQLYRFDRPAPERYLSWVGSLITGDFGVSLKTSRPVLVEFAARLPISGAVAAGAILVACVIGLTLGLLSVIFEDTIVDHAIRGLSVACSSLPVFSIGLGLLYVFSFRLGWFPLYGIGGGMGCVLPASALGAVTGVSLARIMRNSLLGAIHEEYFLAALGKGIPYRSAIVRHALPNALTPSVTYLAMRFSGLLGGIVLVETVFSLPGMGSYLYDAVISRDYPVIQGYIVVFGLIVVVMNIIADMLVRFIDPRPTHDRMH